MSLSIDVQPQRVIETVHLILMPEHVPSSSIGSGESRARAALSDVLLQTGLRHNASVFNLELQTA